MNKNYKLVEFLELLVIASGDEALELISKFQCGAITVEDISCDDFIYE